MFAVHAYAVLITQFRWDLVEQTSQSFAALQRVIGDSVLPALEQLAEILKRLEIDEGAGDEG